VPGGVAARHVLMAGEEGHRRSAERKRSVGAAV
jgi:hypothetical protein